VITGQQRLTTLERSHIEHLRQRPERGKLGLDVAAEGDFSLRMGSVYVALQRPARPVPPFAKHRANLAGDGANQSPLRSSGVRTTFR
jgi:hypothetical protein